jgi:hypothetical protein
VLTVATQGVAPAIFPFVAGVLSALVALGRRKPAPRPAENVARAA